MIKLDQLSLVPRGHHLLVQNLGPTATGKPSTETTARRFASVCTHTTMADACGSSLLGDVEAVLG